MKESKKDRCPGCGKHCSAKNPGCGYGRKYFAKQQTAEPMHKSVDAYYESLASSPKKNKCHSKERRPKWEPCTRRGGLAWLLLTAGREAKHAMHHSAWNEDAFFSALNLEEQHLLLELLQKLALHHGIME